ncbi:MAG: MFS transporter, partial [Pseudomonadales bacterium]|nr:MFS transporter [Pseudomonadales bacterium]
MKQLLLPITALLFSQALLLIGHGLQLTLLPIRAAMEQFTDFQIATTGSSYFLGFVLGCLISPHLIRRVGHIRSFAVLGSFFSALILLFDVFPNYPVWLGLRLLVGMCISGLYMIIESWLNERASSETRGTLLSIYTVINLAMMMVGQQLLNFADPKASDLFTLAAILLSLAILPVSMTLSLQPAPLASVRLDLRKIWKLSHVGMGGALAAGLASGAFWSLGPVYAKSVGLSTAQLTLFMSAAVLGGAIFQLPFGRLSDHYDRRLVVLFLSVAGASISLLLVFLPNVGNLLLGLSFLWGATVMTLYAI